MDSYPEPRPEDRRTVTGHDPCWINEMEGLYSAPVYLHTE